MSAPTEAPAYGSPAWVEWRRGGLGASDLAAALGLDPYRTEHELWEVKTGRAPASPGNPRTRWGHRLEAVGLEIWREAHRVRRPYPNDQPLRRGQWPHLWATPDAIAGRVGIEVKVTEAWVTPPERVRVQALGQAGLGDLERVDVVRLSFTEDPAIFPVERDEAVIRDILDACEAWYVRHVLGDVEPPRREGEVPADERQTALAADLRSVRKAMELLERQERQLRDDLIASVAGQGIIAGTGWRVEVTRARGATRTGWKDVTDELWQWTQGLDPAPEQSFFDELVSRHSTTSNPSTRLTARWDEEEDRG